MDFNGRQQPPPQQQGPLAVLTITYNRDKSYKVDGPISDPTLAFGMLEVAKVVIMDNIKKQKESPIIPVVGVPDGLLRRG